MNELESCMLSLNSSNRELTGWVQHYSSSMLRNSLLLRDFDPSLSAIGIIEVPKTNYWCDLCSNVYTLRWASLRIYMNTT